MSLHFEYRTWYVLVLSAGSYQYTFRFGAAGRGCPSVLILSLIALLVFNLSFIAGLCHFFASIYRPQPLCNADPALLDGDRGGVLEWMVMGNGGMMTTLTFGSWGLRRLVVVVVSAVHEGQSGVLNGCTVWDSSAASAS